MPNKTPYKDLLPHFNKLGTAPTEMSRWNEAVSSSDAIKIQNYIGRLETTGILSPAEIALQNSRGKVQSTREKLDKPQLSLLEKASSGAIDFFNFIFSPVIESVLDLFIYRRRPVYNALKLAISSLIIGGIIASVLLFPALSIPITWTLGLLGKSIGASLLIGGALVAGRFIFKWVGDFLNEVYTKEPHYLSALEVAAWREKTGFDEPLLRIIKQYMVNARNTSQDPHLAFFIQGLIDKELSTPSETSLVKLGAFFIRQLIALRQEKRLHPDDELVNLDIQACTLILNKFAYTPLMPAGAKGNGGMRARIQTLLYFSIPAPPSIELAKPVTLARRHSTGGMLDVRKEPEQEAENKYKAKGPPKPTNWLPK